MSIYICLKTRAKSSLASASLLYTFSATYVSSMENMNVNNNNNGEILLKLSLAGGEDFLDAKKSRDFDLNAPLVEIISPEPSPINVMPPNSQVPASNCPIAIGGLFVDFEPHSSIDDTDQVHVYNNDVQYANNNEILDDGNNNNNVDIPVPDCEDAGSIVEGGLNNNGTKRKFDGKGSWDEEVRSSSAYVVNVIDLTHPLTIDKAKALLDHGVEVPGLSSIVADLDDGCEDGTSPRIFSLEGDAVDDESAPKRRKLDELLIEYAWTPKLFCKPRLVIQVLSDVDIVNDGYQWKKYGQKIIKCLGGPRSYYRCRAAGCPVKKHVERPPYDIRYVLTTYEGKHNHEVPLGGIRNKLNTRVENGSDHNDNNNNNAPPPVAAENANPMVHEQPQLGAQSFNNNANNMNMNFGSSSSNAPNMNYPSLKNGDYGMPYYGSYYDQFVAPPQAEPGVTFHDSNPTSQLALNLNLASSHQGFSHQGGIDHHRLNYVNPIGSAQSLFIAGHSLMKENGGGFLWPNNHADA